MSSSLQHNTDRRDFDKLYAPLHRSILAGNLSGIAQRDQRFEYNVGGGGKFVLWPGSGLHKKNARSKKEIQTKKEGKTDSEKTGLPHWVVAAERLETSRKYLRTAAQIEANWIEPLAKHLLSREYFTPHWDSTTGYVHAFEKITLFGIVLVPKRRINFGSIEPGKARDVFIQSALVEGDLETKLEFFVHNQSVLDEARRMQDKVRQHDMLQPESARYQFYQERIPDDVFDKRSLEKYAQKHSTRDWFMTLDDLCKKSADVSAFPDRIHSAQSSVFDIEYRYAPGEENDGLTLLVPKERIQHLEPARLGWLVPGLVEQKITALLKSLPKEIRRQIVPIPDTVKEMMYKIQFGEGDLEGQVCKEVTRLVGRIIVPTDFNTSLLPPELRMNVRILDTKGKVLGEGKDFLSLRNEHAPVETAVTQTHKAEKEFYELHRRAIKMQVQHLPNADKWKLYSKTIPNFNFNEEVGMLITARAMQINPDASGITAAVQDVTVFIISMLETYHQAKLVIEKNKPHPAALEAEEHLRILTQTGFLSVTDWNYLKEYPRYFRAVPMRLEKMRSGGEQADRHGSEELKQYWQKYLQRKELHELAGIVDPELEVFRWMIEEYRISLFAQRLGTLYKVSPQRLDKQFEKVRR